MKGLMVYTVNDKVAVSLDDGKHTRLITDQEAREMAREIASLLMNAACALWAKRREKKQKEKNA